MRAILYLGLVIIAIIVMAMVLPPLLGASDPNSPYQQALQREQIRRENNWTIFIERATNILLFIITAVAVILLVAACITMYLAYRRAEMRNNSQTDGAFAIQHMRVTITDPITGKRKKTTASINHNHHMGPAIFWNPFTNSFETQHGDFTTAAQEAFAHARTRVASIQAAVPGDAAHIAQANAARKARNFTFKPPPAPPGWIDRKQPDLPKLPAITTTATNAPLAIEPTTWQQAWQRSEPTRWLVGYNAQNGAEAFFDLEEDTHCGILGATGTGKTTSLTFFMIGLAIKHGMHCMIFDGKGGADLRIFARHAEYAPSSGIAFAHQIKAVHDEFQRRRDLLNATNCSNIDDYNANANEQLPRVLVVIEEFGRIWESIPTVGRQGALLAQLDDLLAMSRFVGFHFVFVDQRPKRWPDQVLTNCKAKFAFYLDGRQAGAINEQGAVTLPKRGVFMRDEVGYRTWDMSGNIVPLLNHLPTNGHIQLLAPPTSTNTAATNNRDGLPDWLTKQPAPDAPAYVDDDPSRFQHILIAYFAADPSRWHESPMYGAADIAQAMADQVDDGRTKDNFKGLAGKMLKTERAAHAKEHAPAVFTPIDPANPTAWELLKMQFPDEPVFLPDSNKPIKAPK